MKPPTRVLLVEDNPIIEESLREALASIDGMEIVHAARTQAQAIAWLAINPTGWDLVVIDIFLREGNGFQVLRHCADRGHERRAVVLTNYTREPMRSSAAAQGADAVFDKSFELEEFVAYCAVFAKRSATSRA